MKTVIAGGRAYYFKESDYEFLDKMHSLIKITEVVSGGARGADTCGEVWANKNNIPIKRFPADWEHLGRIAGIVRNRQMAEYCDCVILFPGGKGTANMGREAKGNNKIIYYLET